jgi:hypothetical protein
VTSLEMENFIETLLNQEQLEKYHEPAAGTKPVVATKRWEIHKEGRNLHYELKSDVIDESKTKIDLFCPNCGYENEERFIIADVFECARCNQLFGIGLNSRHITTAKEHGYNQFQKYCTECFQLIGEEWYMLRHGQRQCSGCASGENRSIAIRRKKLEETEKQKRKVEASQWTRK